MSELQTMSDRQSRVGVAFFGIGRIGEIHLQNIVVNPRINLKWIIEVNPDDAKKYVRSHGVSIDTAVVGLDGIDKVLKDESVEAVVICTPTDTHPNLSERALQSGKHVFCEKPISEETSKVKECYDVADRCNKTLFAAFDRKFDNSSRDIYNRVRAGEVGDIYLVRSTLRDNPLWLGAESLSQTFLSHEIDQLCSIADDLPDSVVTMATANIQAIKEKGDVDNVVVTMTFPSGTIGVMDFSRYCCYGYDVRLEVFGSKGMLKMDHPTQTANWTYNQSRIVAPPMSSTFSDRFAQAYASELDHFIDVIQGKDTLRVPRIHCERIGIVKDAIRESYKTGQVVYLRKTNDESS